MENNLRKIREEKGISISEIARRAGISRPYFYMVENGTSKPSFEMMWKIASGLGVDVGEVFDLSMPKTSGIKVKVRKRIRIRIIRRAEQ